MRIAQRCNEACATQQWVCSEHAPAISAQLPALCITATGEEMVSCGGFFAMWYLNSSAQLPPPPAPPPPPPPCIYCDTRGSLGGRGAYLCNLHRNPGATCSS